MIFFISVAARDGGELGENSARARQDPLLFYSYYLDFQKRKCKKKNEKEEKTCSAGEEECKCCRSRSALW